MVHGRNRFMSATVSGGTLLERNTSSFRTLRSISTSGSTSRDDGILWLTLANNYKYYLLELFKLGKRLDPGGNKETLFPANNCKNNFISKIYSQIFSICKL